MPPKKKTGTLKDYFKSNNKKMETEQEEQEETKEDLVASKKKQNKSSDDFPAFDEFVGDLQTWKPMLQSYTSQKTFRDTYDYVKQAYKTSTCYPPSHLIFSAFELSSVQQLKVIVVGQDPYHQPGQAMGLCFSVPKDQKFPPSLNNIYKSMQADPKMPKFSKPTHGDLTKWATQGVFLLNDILTVKDSTPNAHKEAKWGKFTDEVIKIINTKCENCVFLLWGKPAQKKAAAVNQSKHLVLKTSHPSPLGAHYGFMTSTQFSECNEYLKKVGKKEINWNWE